MPRSLALLAALAVALTTCPLHAQQPAVEVRTSEIRTTGLALRQVRPDLATFVLQFSETGRTPVAAGRAVAARADSLRQALVRVGIPRDSIATRSQGWHFWRQRVEIVPLAPRQVGIPDALPGQNPVRTVYDTVYRVNEAIEVRVRDLALVGGAIDAALALRVTDISPVSFRVTDQTALREDMLRQATRHARRQAEIIAEASGTRLGRTLLLSTEPLDEVYRNVDLMARSAAGDSDAAQTTFVSTPMATLRLVVHARWEIVTP